MWNGQITVKANSNAELQERIKDNEKRGFVLKRSANAYNGWGDRRFTAVMEKKEGPK